MQGWSIRAGRGWRDRMPPEVKDLFERHAGYQELALLTVEAHSQVAEYHGEGCSLPIHDVPDRCAQDCLNAMGAPFGAMAKFLRNLTYPEVDVTSLIFINFATAPRDPGIKPEERAAKVGSLDEGLQLFCEDVHQSIGAPEFPMSCQWAMLSAERVVASGP